MAAGALPTRVIVAVIATAAVMVCAAAPPRADQFRSGLDVAGFDRGVTPQDDLYRHVNGGWLARTPMPGDRVSYGAFAEIGDRTEANLRAIIEELVARPGRTRGSPAQQIAALYTSAVHEARLPRVATASIQPELRRIDAIQSTR